MDWSVNQGWFDGNTECLSIFNQLIYGNNDDFKPETLHKMITTLIANRGKKLHSGNTDSEKTFQFYLSQEKIGEKSCGRYRLKE